jgi:hypothetical protein
MTLKQFQCTVKSARRLFLDADEGYQGGTAESQLRRSITDSPSNGRRHAAADASAQLRKTLEMVDASKMRDRLRVTSGGSRESRICAASSRISASLWRIAFSSIALPGCRPSEEPMRWWVAPFGPGAKEPARLWRVNVAYGDAADPV